MSDIDINERECVPAHCIRERLRHLHITNDVRVYKLTFVLSFQLLAANFALAVMARTLG